MPTAVKCTVLNQCIPTVSCNVTARCYVLTCRTKVEMQAAAASTIRNVGSQILGGTAGISPQDEVGAEKMPGLPRWDCNNGDTWHKRQRVYSTPLQCVAVDCCSSHAVILWIPDIPLCCFLTYQHIGERQDAERECLVHKAAASSTVLRCTIAMLCYAMLCYAMLYYVCHATVTQSSRRQALHEPCYVFCHGRTNPMPAMVWHITTPSNTY